MNIPNLECDLPYNKNNLSKININNKLNITGKNLNTEPKELLKNDEHILSKLNFLYESISELKGDNAGGLISHINDLSLILDNIKNKDEYLAQQKFNFLKANDCNLKIDDLFPCKDLSPTDEYVYFNNTHINYTKDYKNKNCEDDDLIIDCNDKIS
jgi:argonaute-like protein implicated in RNA metabolism and viral defense